MRGFEIGREQSKEIAQRTGLLVNTGLPGRDPGRNSHQFTYDLRCRPVLELSHSNEFSAEIRFQFHRKDGFFSHFESQQQQY